MFLRATAIACVLLAGCTVNPEKIIAPDYAVNVNWANKIANIGVDKYARLLPLVIGSTIIMADRSGQLMHYNTSTGKLIWNKQFDARFSAGPSLSSAGDMTIIGSQEGDVYSVSTSNGDTLWEQTLSSEILSTPQQRGDVVVVQTNDGKAYGLSAATGKVTWVYERTVPVLSLRGNSTPLIVSDQVVVGFANGRLVALALDDGKLLWESSLAVPKGRTELERMTDIDGPIVEKDGILYVSAYHGQVAAMGADSGRMIWAREMSSQLGVTVGETLVFVTTASGQVWALSRESGATLWMQDKLEDIASTRPAIVGDKLAVGASTGDVYWISTSDGQLLGRLSRDRVSELAGASEYVEHLDDDDKYFPPKPHANSVTFRPEVVGNNLFIVYQDGIIASVSAAK